MKWVKASESSPFKGNKICRWYEHGEFERIDIYSWHTLTNWANLNRKQLEDIEYLDESSPSFTLQQALDIWDAGVSNQIDKQYSSVNFQMDKKQYFKEQFNIDI